MTVLIDTSVWVNVFRDVTGSITEKVVTLIGDESVALTRFTQMELLQGAANDQEWHTLSEYLDGQEYLEIQDSTWRNAALIYYELRRLGRTVRSAIDCCIAQLAMDHRVILLHEDRDFEVIANIRPLMHQRL